ncbi:hypothetical protein CC86DRAFT_389116, partial [Ophiobolus disseminans]
LEHIKRSVDVWLRADTRPDYNDLVALVHALDLWKKEAEQKLSETTSNQAEEVQPSPASESATTGFQRVNQPGADQMKRRSNRIAAMSPLFVAENESPSDTNGDDFAMPDAALRDQSGESPSLFAHRRNSTAFNAPRSATSSEGEQGRHLSPTDHDTTPYILFSPEPADSWLDDIDSPTNRPIWLEQSPVEHSVNPNAGTPRFETSGTDIELPEAPSPHFFDEAFQSGRDGTTVAEDVQRYVLQSPSQNPDASSQHYIDGALHFDKDYTANLKLDRVFNKMTADDWENAMLGEPQHFQQQSQARNSAEHSIVTPGPNVIELDHVFGATVADSQEQETAMADDSRQAEGQPRSQPQNFAENAFIKNYLDIACQSNFGLPNERLTCTDRVDVEELLRPLVEEAPLSARLVNSLLYTLLPSTVRLVEVGSCNDHNDLFLDEDVAESFVAVIVRAEETPPFLVLGDWSTKTLFILESKTEHLPILEVFRSQCFDWEETYVDPHTVGPHIESSLLSIFIAEACFMNHLPITQVPDSRHLRLRFLGELVAPYESDLVLEQCGIPENFALVQKVDVREIAAQTETLTQTLTIEVPELEKFDMHALHRVLRERPAEISRKRCLRILQYVNEIGSSNILEALKLGLAAAPRERTAKPTERPFVEKLFHIHLYLDNQDSQSHLLVARNRYIKYCYYETYLHAEEALQTEKRNSSREKRKISAIKLTESYQKGFRGSLPPTPHTDVIEHTFTDLDNAQKKRRAPDMIKDEIAQRLAKHYKRDEKRIRQDITRYIKEGKALHFILQGTVCLNPGLLVLFPSKGAHPPSLEMDHFMLDLDEAEQKSLGKPIDTKEYDLPFYNEGVSLMLF